MTEPSIQGMTVNERLFHFGLFESFDLAATARDHAGLVEVLLNAQFSKQQAEETATAVLGNPAYYGF